MRWIFAAWFAVGALTTAQSWLQRSLNGTPLRPNFLVIWVISLLFWGLLTPVMWRLSNRVRLEDGTARFILTHLSAALAFTVAEAALDSFFLLKFLGLQQRSWSRMILDMSVINTVSYAAGGGAAPIQRHHGRSAGGAA